MPPTRTDNDDDKCVGTCITCIPTCPRNPANAALEIDDEADANVHPTVEQEDVPPSKELRA